MLRDITVVIPYFNQLELTRSSVRRILSMPAEDVPQAIILVDDGSDEACLPSEEQAVKVLRLGTNQGFPAAVNHGVAAAETPWVVVLNNDVEVQPGWLSELYATAQRHDPAIVSSLLLNPDGSVQQHGGYLFNQATAVPFGNRLSPTDPEMLSLGEPHYVSFTAVLMRREVFLDAGGLDLQFAPGYYEDADFSFRLAGRGIRLLSDPGSHIIHLGSQSFGRDEVRKSELLEAHRRLFFARWGPALADHAYPHPLATRASLSPTRSHILFVDETLPWPDRASGGVRLEAIVDRFLGQGWLVTFVGAVDEEDSPYVRALRRKGVVVYPGAGRLSGVPWARILESRIDVAWIARGDLFNQVASLINLLNPAVTLWYDTVDLAWRRQVDPRKRQSAMARETVAAEEAAHVFVVGESERRWVSELNPHVSVVGNIHTVPASTPDGSARRDVVFVGNFFHMPNVDAAVHLVAHIWPVVHAEDPDITLRVVGANAPPSLMAHHGQRNIIVEGHVADLDALLSRCRVSVAPLRIGAGIKGKVGQALALGLPVVASPKAVEDMPVEDAVRVADPDNPSAFAEAILSVYRDDALWDRMHKEGPDLVRHLYSRDQAEKGLLPALASVRWRLSVSLVMLSWNRREWTAKAVDSVLANTSDLKELIVVDNASTDGSWEWLLERAAEDARLVPVKNRTNYGFAGGMNAGLRRAHGEIVGVLNNDVLVPPGWMPRMLARFGNPDVVAVGPVTSRISGTQCVDASYSEDQFNPYAQEWFYAHVGQSLYTPRLVAFVLLVRREALDRLGGFDVRFGRGNFEDDDFSIRLASLGRLVIAYDVLVHHEGSVSFRDVPAAEVRQLYESNQAWLHKKWGPVWDASGRWLPQPTRSYGAEMFCPMVSSLERVQILGEVLRQRQRGEWGYAWLTLNFGIRDEVLGVAEVLTLLHLNAQQAVQVAGQLTESHTRLEMSIALALALEASGRQAQAERLWDLLARQWPHHPYTQDAEHQLWTWVEAEGLTRNGQDEEAHA